MPPLLILSLSLPPSLSLARAPLSAPLLVPGRPPIASASDGTSVGWAGPATGRGGAGAVTVRSVDCNGHDGLMRASGAKPPDALTRGLTVDQRGTQQICRTTVGAEELD
ncbi:hypothetical protein K431DRAFT_293313 [Polychaeton citri CBS 116435]|uniref:Secreted protein n=1 Tax=Polychaeton citri CBS 116435 TaxID=1314669 RepID=A0A9P4US42_9PEZI|nr:hypothetical protein K431DRAFT_293313 [Polychaeton citri CBS 116435]